jgi:hypothetical protein
MDLTDFLFLFALSFLCTPGMLFRLPLRGSKLVVAIVHALVFSILLFAYNAMKYRSPEGFTQNGRNDSIYDDAFDKCMNVNSPPFMGSVSDTINYCLNRISSRFVK